jgi:NitT/TauT family transport system ATP-binding protein
VHESGQEVRALDGISFSIPRGQFVCAVGPSGQGKTTLLHVIAGLVKPSAGEVFVDGKRVEGPGWERGMVFQENAVFPWKKVKDNVAYGLLCRGFPKVEIKKRVDEYLRLVGLENFAGSWPRELSGGMLQRVAVATVFANDAHVMLMDEPFGALDYVTRTRLQEVLIDLWRRTHKTILFVTHDVDEAVKLADRLLVIRHGRLTDDFLVNLPRGEKRLASLEGGEIRNRLLHHLGLDIPLVPSELGPDEVLS